MTRAIAAFALVLAVFASPASALDCPTPYLCFLNGSWAADGTAFGKPARVTMRWESVLGGKFGTWFDSHGAMHPLQATFTGAKLTTHWGVKGKTYGRTTYTMIGHEHVEVVDEVQNKGAWKEFARNTLTKVE